MTSRSGNSKGCALDIFRHVVQSQILAPNLGYFAFERTGDDARTADSDINSYFLLPDPMDGPCHKWVISGLVGKDHKFGCGKAVLGGAQFCQGLDRVAHQDYGIHIDAIARGAHID